MNSTLQSWQDMLKITTPGPVFDTLWWESIPYDLSAIVDETMLGRLSASDRGTIRRIVCIVISEYRFLSYLDEYQWGDLSRTEFIATHLKRFMGQLRDAHSIDRFYINADSQIGEIEVKFFTLGEELSLRFPYDSDNGD